ncbi:MAG TPA: transglycosylase domain-containing protein [Pseudoneobacillus sp.]|nr:transglycosylase domain-containing protein [Pseudoneobacillus sp.]
MNNKSNNWLDKFRNLTNLFTHKRTVKSARITYQVVWSLLLLLFIVVLLGGAFAGGVGAGYFASLVKDEPLRPYENMKKDIYNYEETSELYFANEEYLGTLRTDLEREKVQLKDVSKYLIEAVVSTEDEYFYDHNGVVPKAIMRALFQEVTNASVQSGGSTLTQQLIKNQILTNEVSFERKAKEILLALRLEKFFDKEEILEAYLNVSTFGRNSSGRNIAGVQTAAKGIFGVNAKDLSLPQAAFIAGLPQSPFGYTPFTRDGEKKKNLEPGLSRMKTVLKRMYDRGSINKNQYDEALAYDVTKDFISPKSSSIEKYPWLTFEVENRAVEILSKILAEKDGYEEKDLKQNDDLNEEYLTLANRNLRQNGYKIHTTIDKEIYDAMQKAKDDYPYYGPDKPQVKKDPETGENITVSEPVEVGAILIENSTGKIISFVGGRDYKRNQVNHATSSVRPNGSTMKPLLVYAPAMELGKASPGTVLPDVALKLDPTNPEPWPKNYDLKYSGLVSARYALTKSYNVPAIKLYSDIIDQRPAHYLEKMGFTSLLEPDFTNLSTAIGSLEKGVTVEENTNAFTTFANDGKFVDAYLIDKIEDNNGNVIYEHKKKSVDVFSPQTAYLTIDMMRDVVRKGTAAAINNRLKFKTDWAGKTGTGHDYHDSWFVATNPNVTFGIWTGYDTPKSLQSNTGALTYSLRTNYLWVDLINAAYDQNPDLIDPAEEFKMPGGIVKRSYCAVSGLLPSDVCERAGLIETDIYNMKYAPTETDSSLIEGKFVRIGDKKYLAMESTPDEFAEYGLIMNPDYIEKLIGKNFADPGQLIPKRERWSRILAPNDKIVENGKLPEPLVIQSDGNMITWSQHPEHDVIGYKVYSPNWNVVGLVKAGSTLAMKVENGKYFVTAIDIDGQESNPSNTVDIRNSTTPTQNGETDENIHEPIDLNPILNPNTKAPKR